MATNIYSLATAKQGKRTVPVQVVAYTGEHILECKDYHVTLPGDALFLKGNVPYCGQCWKRLEAWKL